MKNINTIHVQGLHGIVSYICNHIKERKKRRKEEKKLDVLIVKEAMLRKDRNE
jgi:hypothetical protein